MLDRNGTNTRPKQNETRRDYLIPEFTDEFVQRLADSLPQPLTPSRRELLPLILCEWSNNELQRRLSWPSSAMLQERRESLKALAKCARRFLKEVDKGNRPRDADVAWAMLSDSWPSVSFVDDLAAQTKRLEDLFHCLRDIAAILPLGKAGGPKKIHPYLVLQDAAAIFEWYSGRKAARGVRVKQHGESGKARATEGGPFHRFASVLWPALFGDGTHGLPAAMKNWASWRDKHGERSALMANIDLRHREWGVFDR
jgi:hypothetical protein